MQCGSKVILSSSASMNVFQHESFPLPEKLLVISAPLNAWNSGTSANLTLPRALAIGRTKIVGQTHDGYHPAYQRQIMSSHTAPDSASEVELKHLCLENGYKSLLQRWQLRPEHAATSWCLLLHDHFEDGSHFDVLHDTGIPRPQQLVDLSS